MIRQDEVLKPSSLTPAGIAFIVRIDLLGGSRSEGQPAILRIHEFLHATMTPGALAIATAERPSAGDQTQDLPASPSPES